MYIVYRGRKHFPTNGLHRENAHHRNFRFLLIGTKIHIVGKDIYYQQTFCMDGRTFGY